ncbi:M20/M25/M40 family metallo-hydrolase [Sediminicola sp. 1XM1-17]|uniref:M20/M25/M40 family metallo-hydrolase n=1 Tax=Sediminicola sp. 1XM1-17 TaxID=3127702 RepID=UPI003076A7FE
MEKVRNPSTIILLALFLFNFFGQSQTLSKQEIIDLSKQKLPEAVTQLKTFLEIPNDGHDPQQIQANLKQCQALFAELDFESQIIKTNGAPLLFAQKVFHQNAKTVLFYLQIDGQPVDTTKWDQKNPFLPVLKNPVGKDQWESIPFDNIQHNFNPEWRIFARSSSDSKGPAMCLISALQILQDQKKKPAYNIKVIMDFQEELGSPHLPTAVELNKDLLKAEMVLIMDGTRHLSNLPTLTYGARGIATATFKVFGPKVALHSGQYGNFAPNPVFNTARLLGKLKDDQGRVTLPGFYDGINLSATEKNILNSLPENLDSIKLELGIAAHDAIGDTYQETLQYPSLNIRGMEAAYVGKEVRTIIPNEVIVEIDMRLVPESNGERLMKSLRQFIINEGFHLVDSIPSDIERNQYPKLASFTYKLGSKAFRTDFDSNVGLMLNRAMNRIFGNNMVNMRTTGGSQPIGAFIETLGIPAVSIRIPNPDNNIHGPNENFRLGNFLEGIQSCLSILDQPIPN